MVDQEMLSAISDLLDEKLEEKLDRKFDEKLQPVYDRLDHLEADMRYVKEEQLENNIIPRLDKLEADVHDIMPRLDKLEADVHDIIPRLDHLEADVHDIMPRLDHLEADVHDIIPRLDHLEADVHDMMPRLDKLETDMRYVRVVQLENGVIPRLNTIEACYLDTSKRYLEKTEQMDNMAADIVVLKNVVSGHSEALQQMQG